MMSSHFKMVASAERLPFGPLLAALATEVRACHLRGSQLGRVARPRPRRGVSTCRLRGSLSVPIIKLLLHVPLERERASYRPSPTTSGRAAEVMGAR